MVTESDVISMGRKKSKRTKNKDKIRAIYSGQNIDDLEIFEAKPELSVATDGKTLNVAAYCRVSTQEEEQTSSFELQVNTYTELIENTPGWNLVNIYADEGISGTNMRKRFGMQKLIDDCIAGKIDMIITKSIARFARNTEDTLHVIKLLKNLPKPVRVKFETENIDTLDESGNLLLTILASLAEEESRNKSRIMNWSYENRIKHGIFLTPSLYGYDVDDDGDLKMNPFEAKVVKLMYYMYLSGSSFTHIARLLTEFGIPTYTGKDTWNPTSVKGILSNERHAGDIVAHKTFTVSCLTHKKKRNNGERTMVRRRDHHEAIVSHQIYDAAVRKMEIERYSTMGTKIPALYVINGGLLKGYVPVNRNWRGYSNKDYEEASRAAFLDEADEMIGSHRRMELQGYETVRCQYFTTSDKPIMTLKDGKIWFNTACMKKFETVEYVEILLNSVDKCLAIRPCNPDSPNAIKWATLKNNRWYVAGKSCAGIVRPLNGLMDWADDSKYQLIGQYLKDGEDQCLLFDLMDAQITKIVEVEDPVETSAVEEPSETDISLEADGSSDSQSDTADTENTDETVEEADTGDKTDAERLLEKKNTKRPRVISGAQDDEELQKKTHKETVVQFRDDSYGRPATIRDDILFDRIFVRGNWEILRPSKFYKYCCDITDADLAALEEEALKILQEFELRQA